MLLINFLYSPVSSHHHITFIPTFNSDTATMDFIKGLASGNKEGEQSQQTGQSEQKSSGGGFMDKLNNAAGGGAAGEKKEDGLDKG